MAQNKVPELNKNDPDSLYNWIAYKVSCPEFRNPIKNYIDENCSTFVDIDENSFEQGQLFNEINLLIENLLKDVLEEGQITQEDFLKAAERGMEDKKYKKYFNQIINFGNYTFFKSVMTKRNYQIIQMAEKQMNQENENQSKSLNQEGNQNAPQENDSGQNRNELNPQIVAQMLENEQAELNEAIRQSLEDEEEKRRIAVIEEEEMRRAIKQSLETSKKENEKKKEEEERMKREKEKEQEQAKKEETKKEEPKKEEPKKEEPKKEEPKKFVPTISTNVNFQFSGEMKPPEKEKTNTTVISANKGFQLQVSSKAEDFGITKSTNNVEIKSSVGNAAPIIAEPAKIEPKKEVKPEEPKKDIKPEEPKEETKMKKVEIKEEKEPENKNIINEPKKEERITRDFVNIFEEKKMTLAPLMHRGKLPNPNIKPSTLKEDLEKSQKTNVQKDIEKMIIKTETKEESESAKDVIKNSLKQSTLNKNDINYMEDDGGLLIDDDEDEVIVGDNKKDNSKSNNINFGRIAIPQNFNDKIPDYNKEKQEQLKKYRDMVLKQKMEEREQQLNK